MWKVIYQTSVQLAEFFKFQRDSIRLLIELIRRQFLCANIRDFYLAINVAVQFS